MGLSGAEHRVENAEARKPRSSVIPPTGTWSEFPDGPRVFRSPGSSHIQQTAANFQEQAKAMAENAMRRTVGVSARSYVLLTTLGVLALPGVVRAQAPRQPDAPQDAQQGSPAGERRTQFAGMGRTAGEITAVAGGTLTLKAEDGNTVQVVTTDNTRVMKDRGPVKVGDLHPGDGVMAFGKMDPATHTLHAAMVMATDAAQVKAMRENLGKTYITGRVTAVDLDSAKMTVQRPDHVMQTIGFDETTSFKRAVRGGAGSGPAMAGGAGLERGFANDESITLGDIKVGDFVAGTGLIKGGIFVPVHLVDSPPGQRHQHSDTAPGSGAAPPDAPGPAPR